MCLLLFSQRELPAAAGRGAGLLNADRRKRLNSVCSGCHVCEGANELGGFDRLVALKKLAGEWHSMV
jgi:cytochrome c553